MIITVSVTIDGDFLKIEKDCERKDLSHASELMARICVERWLGGNPHKIPNCGTLEDLFKNGSESGLPLQ